MKIDEIQKIVGGELRGTVPGDITDIGTIQRAGSEHLSFLSDARYSRYLLETEAAVVLISPELVNDTISVPLLVVDDPHTALIALLPHFRKTGRLVPPGISAQASVDPTAILSVDVSVGPYATIGPNATVGPGTRVASGVFVGADVVIGANCVIDPGTILYPGTRIGDRVEIAAGSVIGSEGFGYVRDDSGTWTKVPQTGIVVIEDDVEIGSCVSIDRGTLDETRICRGAKLDNQIHIAHNVVVGAHTVIAAQTGISGSTTIGERNLIAGQVGVVGHIETTDDVIIEAQSGVSKSLVKAGRYFGHPAKEHAVALRQEGALRQLPDLLREIREMKRVIEQLQKEVQSFEEGVDQE